MPQKLKKFLPFILVLILFALAIFLGYKVFGLVTGRTISTLTAPKVDTQNKNANVNEDLRFLTNLSLDKMGENDKTRLFEAITNIAADGGTLKISDTCQVKPFAIKISNQEELQISNVSNKNHTFSLEGNIEIPAGDTASFNTTVLKEGIYRYGCDGNPSGYIWKTNK